MKKALLLLALTPGCSTLHVTQHALVDVPEVRYQVTIKREGHDPRRVIVVGYGEEVPMVEDRMGIEDAVVSIKKED